MSNKLADSKALLNNLLKGTALPEHLSKPRSEGLDRKALAAEVADKLTRSPLFAVCFDHKCRCNRQWKSFGYYARNAKVAVAGQGSTETIARIDYIPHNEPVVKTFWHTVEEPVCINCFDAATNIASQEAASA